MLEGTVSVVTGASRGIGLEIARTQAAAGATVAIIARNGTAIEAAASAIAAGGGRVKGFSADLANHAEVDTTFLKIFDQMGPVDALINNAGAFSAIGPIWEVDPDDWWNDIEVNLKSAFYCTRAVMPSMLSRRRGRIVNLIGGGTSRPLPFGSAYSISKTGIMRLTECLAQTLEGTGVVCLAMDPGLVATDLTRFQMESAAGVKYMPGVGERLRSGDHLPPTHAAQLALAMTLGRFDRMTGRAIRAYDDLDEVEASMDAILTRNERVLRVVGFEPPSAPGMPSPSGSILATGADGSGDTQDA